MVAENPLSNGNDRGPSLPPEPPDTDGPKTLTLDTDYDSTAKNVKATEDTLREIKDPISGMNLLPSTANLA